MRLHKKSIVPEYFAAIGKILSQREINFLNSYVKNGNLDLAIAASGISGKNPVTAAKRILKKQLAQDYLAKLREKAAIRVSWVYDDKLAKLKQIALTAIPDNAESIKERAADVAIKAIAEANKMQGDYAAEKRVNMNIDTDIEQAKQLTQELLEKYRREY